jgi:sigma-B regulation protein RsbU (phosphoserine phosphatase)
MESELVAHRLEFLIESLSEMEALAAEAGDLESRGRLLLRALLGTAMATRGCIYRYLPDQGTLVAHLACNCTPTANPVHVPCEIARELVDGRGRGFSVAEDNPLGQWLREQRELLEPIEGRLAFPLAAQGRLVGLLVVGAKLAGEPFTPEEIQTIALLARPLSTAYLSARLLGEAREANFQLRQKVLALETLGQVGRAITSLHSVERLETEVLARASSLLDASHGALVHWDPDGRPVLAAAFGFHPEEAQTPANIRELLRELERRGAGQVKEILRGDQLIAAPMIAQERSMGVICVANKETRNGTIPFDENDESLLLSFASLVAIAFENAELHQAALEKQRYEREIELAAEIQRGLLPREIPSIPGYRFLGFTRPSREIGGDLYDIIDLGQGRIAAVVADVTGKGVPAALLVSTLHAGLHLLEEELHDPLTVVHKLNRLICHSSAGNKFITMVLFVLDTRTHRLLAVNAGHNHPVILLPHGEIRRIPAGGIPLGILEQMRYESAELQLPPGALVLAFTDGISETRDPQGDEFGERRLIELIRAHPPGEGETLAQELLGRLADFRGCDAQEDDITCLLLQRLPESSEQAPAVQGPPG